jgi:hypothetical protein
MDIRNIASATASAPRAGAIGNAAGFAILAAVWLVGIPLGFRLGVDRLLLSTDGRYYLTMALSRAGLAWPWTSDSIDFLHGIGDQLFPFRPEIIPVFRILTALGFTDTAKVAAFSWLALELALSITFLARSMGAALRSGLGASALAIVCLLPLWKFGATYTFVHIAPQFSSLVAATAMAAGLYLRVGRASPAIDFMCLIALATVFLWFIHAAPPAFILPAPLLGITALVGLFAASSAQERWRKFAVLAALGVLIGCGPIWYVLAEVMTSAAFVFNVELQNSLATWGFASIIFHLRDIGPMGPILVLSAVAGAVLHWRSSNRTLRFFGYGIISYLVTRLTFAWATITFDFWRGPAPIYFELFVIPLYCLFAWLFWERAVAWMAAASPRWKRLPHWFSTYASAAVLIGAVATGGRYRVPDLYLFPPPGTAITEYLAEHARLVLGRSFAGRVATMNGLNLGASTNWFELVGNLDQVTLRHTGNDHRQSGLRYFGIPVLFEYSPAVTAPFYAFTTRLLARPQDEQVRNVQVLRRVEPRILAMLGVRYVITDRPVDDERLEPRVALPLGKDGKLNLYEIAHPNLGDYSPTTTMVKSSAAEMLREIARAAFDPARAVVLDANPQAPALTPAANATMIFEGARLHVTADSASRSLLVLPLQYSHCLEVEATGQAPPALLRANLLETAVVFEKHVDARIELRTGPFVHPLCRFDDAADDKRLRTGEVPRNLMAEQPRP